MHEVWSRRSNQRYSLRYERCALLPCVCRAYIRSDFISIGSDAIRRVLIYVLIRYPSVAWTVPVVSTLYRIGLTVSDLVRAAA